MQTSFPSISSPSSSYHYESFTVARNFKKSLCSETALGSHPSSSGAEFIDKHFDCYFRERASGSKALSLKPVRRGERWEASGVHCGRGPCVVAPSGVVPWWDFLEQNMPFSSPSGSKPPWKSVIFCSERPNTTAPLNLKLCNPGIRKLTCTAVQKQMRALLEGESPDSA